MSRLRVQRNEDDEPEWDAVFMCSPFDCGLATCPRVICKTVTIRRSFGDHFWLSLNGVGWWPGLGSEEWIEVVW